MKILAATRKPALLFSDICAFVIKRRPTDNDNNDAVINKTIDAVFFIALWCLNRVVIGNDLQWSCLRNLYRR
uniref:Uncharacterized protein n=1 Tax=Helianthus annuus TaxID=4232 RepID=A0A251VR33_HELAN